MWRVTCDSGFLTCLVSGICAAHFLSLITYSPYREKCDVSEGDRYTVSGSSSVGEVDHGIEVTFACKSGYTVDGDLDFTCTDGHLDTPACKGTLYATSDIDHHDG